MRETIGPAKTTVREIIDENQATHLKSFFCAMIDIYIYIYANFEISIVKRTMHFKHIIPLHSTLANVYNFTFTQTTRTKDIHVSVRSVCVNWLCDHSH